MLLNWMKMTENTKKQVVILRSKLWIKRIKLLLRSLRLLHKDVLITIRISKDNTKYLKSGNYKLFTVPKIGIYNQTDLSEKFVVELSSRLNWKSSKLYSGVFSLYSTLFKVQIPLEEKHFHADLMFITREDEPKYFDLVNKKVLTIIYDAERYNKIQEANSTFSKYYLTTVRKFDNVTQSIEESLILSLDEQILSKEEILEEVMKKTMDIHSKEVIVYKNVDKLLLNYLTNLKNKINKANYNYLENKLLKIKNTEIPSVISHGDLNFNNIVTENNKFYIIDWEDSGNRIFYYDIINLIVQDKITTGSRLYDDFLQGKYDKMLLNIFDNINVKYNHHTKKELLIIYFIERLYQLDQYITTDLNKVVENYKKMIESIRE